MNNVFGLFVIIGVFGDLAFCKFYYPLPYRNQNDEYGGKLFDSFFPNPVPNEARNDSLTTSTPPTTSKPISTTETVVFYPVYQEPIYDPNYYPIIPPYPVFYNAPLDSSQLQADNFAPYYPVVNNIPSFYSNGIQPIPFLNPGLFNAVPERVILNPNLPNAKPANLKPSSVPSPSQSQNLNAGEVKNDVQKALNEEVEKLLDEFYAKHSHVKGQDNIESSTKTNIETSNVGEVDEYKIEPWIPVVPEVSAHPVPNHIPSVTKKIISVLKKNVTNKLEENINQGVELNEKLLVNQLVSNPAKITPSAIQVNQLSTQTASQNETDDSRKLDFNDEEGFTTDTTIDKSPSITAKDLIKVLENNQTFAESKLNDSITGESTTNKLVTRKFFFNANGDECMEEIVVHENEQYKLYTCKEKSYAGKSSVEGRITRKSDVTYFTEELLTTEEPTTELPPQNQSPATDNIDVFD